MKKTNVTIKLLHQVWDLTKSYWKSEEKKKAYGLLLAIVVLNLGVVFVLVLLNEWNNSFYTALQDYAVDEIFHQLWRFTILAFSYIILAVYAYYLQQTLIVNWRRWLTRRYVEEWLSAKTYYRLEMFGKDMDNPDQRISEDVSLFVTRTLSLAIGLMKAICTLLSFIVILWNLSGPFVVSILGKEISIPGYMVWVAICYAGLGTFLIHKVGHRLVNLNFVQQRYEADFRFSMMRLRENAESVAFYHGEPHEKSVFLERFRVLLENFWKIVKKQKQLVWLNSGVFPDCHHLSFCGGHPALSETGTDLGRPDAGRDCFWTRAGFPILFCRCLCNACRMAGGCGPLDEFPHPFGGCRDDKDTEPGHSHGRGRRKVGPGSV